MKKSSWLKWRMTPKNVSRKKPRSRGPKCVFPWESCRISSANFLPRSHSIKACRQAWRGFEAISAQPGASAHNIEDDAIERLSGVESQEASLPLATQFGEPRLMSLAILLIKCEQIAGG